VTRRPGGVGVYDPDTLKTALPAAETVYAGPAFYSDRLSGHPRDTGHADLREHHGVVRFPSPSAAVEVDDEIRFVDGPCEGMTFTVKAILNQTSELSRRVAVFRDDPEVMHS
jgi:hypothetical protein